MNFRPITPFIRRQFQRWGARASLVLAILSFAASANAQLRNNWEGDAFFGDDVWVLPGNWSFGLPLPGEIARFGDIAGNTDVSVVGLFRSSFPAIVSGLECERARVYE